MLILTDVEYIAAIGNVFAIASGAVGAIGLISNDRSILIFSVASFALTLTIYAIANLISAVTTSAIFI